MRRTSILILVLILGMVLAACSSDPTTSEEYLDLEQELTLAEGQIEDLETQLEAVAAERDELLAYRDAPAGVFAVIDEWYEANQRRDGSVVDLYAASGYHHDGTNRVSRDSIASHFTLPAGWEAEWISDPFLVVDDGNGRYVVSRGLRIANAAVSNESAITFEIEETSDGALEIIHTTWTYAH